MRATLRLFAVVKPATRFLEPGAPTGLTGLYTHSSPRTALIYTYSSTLDKLRHFPESSVYRISTEALTKHRLSIVESYLPEGYEAWQDRVRTHIEKHKDLYAQLGYGKEQVLDGRHFFPMQRQEALTDETDDYDGAPPNQAVMLTPTDEAQREWLVSEIMKPKMTREAAETMALEPEPQLSTDQCVKFLAHIW